jgi:hypothetical protein
MSRADIARNILIGFGLDTFAANQIVERMKIYGAIVEPEEEDDSE